jgi:hypothetical protein
MNLLRERAVRLRRSGSSYGEISQELQVPKSTLSYWLKTVPLSAGQRKRLYTKQIAILTSGPRSQKNRRADEVRKIVSEAKREVPHSIDSEIIRFIGIALYWAEGSKGKSVRFTNSDPSMILFMVRWFKKVLGIEPTNLRAHINIYRDRDERKIKAFWSELTGIPLGNFGKSYLKPPGKGYRKNNLYYGTLRIYVTRSTDVKYRMDGWLEGLLEKCSSKVNLPTHPPR